MAFQESQFPIDISVGATSTTERKTDIVELRSGKEQRNAVWSNSRRSYDVGTGIIHDYMVSELLEFYEGVRGPKDGFRFKDFADYMSCALNFYPSELDQEIGTGDGARVAFQITKTYGERLTPWTRIITKPVANTTLVAVDGVLWSDWTIDTTTGIITFGSAPADNAVITAGYEFDVPVRFMDDKIDINLKTMELGESAQIMLIEIK